jgi:hypothetical protein
VRYTVGEAQGVFDFPALGTNTLIVITDKGADSYP